MPNRLFLKQLHLLNVLLGATGSSTWVRYVRVEVQVPCRAPDVLVLMWAVAGLRRTDSMEVKVRALLAERRQRIGYARQLEAMTAACQ